METPGLTLFHTFTFSRLFGLFLCIPLHATQIIVLYISLLCSFILFLFALRCSNLSQQCGIMLSLVQLKLQTKKKTKLNSSVLSIGGHFMQNT